MIAQRTMALAMKTFFSKTMCPLRQQPAVLPVIGRTPTDPPPIGRHPSSVENCAAQPPARRAPQCAETGSKWEYFWANQTEISTLF